MDSTGAIRRQSDLAEMVELLLDKGVVINADIVVSIGDTELLGVELRAAIASFETAAEYGLEFPEGTDRERIEAAAERSGEPPRRTKARSLGARPSAAPRPTLEDDADEALDDEAEGTDEDDTDSEANGDGEDDAGDGSDEDGEDDAEGGSDGDTEGDPETEEATE